MFVFLFIKEIFFRKGLCYSRTGSSFLLLELFTFSFALMQKKKITKRKNQGCTFWATPALFYTKQKELAVAQTAFCS